MAAIANTGLEVMLAGALAAGSAQGFKLIWFLARQEPVNFRVLVSTGGMPSSHSAFMTALATSVGLIEGFNAVSFAIALGLAIIVMYDAAGVRRAAGHMAGVLNKMTEDMYQHHPEKVPERLKELLGHTPVEVVVGAFLGCVVSYALHIRL